MSRRRRPVETRPEEGMQRGASEPYAAPPPSNDPIIDIAIRCRMGTPVFPTRRPNDGRFFTQIFVRRRATFAMDVILSASGMIRLFNIKKTAHLGRRQDD